MVFKVEIGKVPKMLKALDIPVVFINGIFGTPKDVLRKDLIELEYNTIELKRPDPLNVNKVNSLLEKHPHVKHAIFADFRDYEEVKNTFRDIERYSYVYIHPNTQVKYYDLISKVTIPVIKYSNDIEQLTISLQTSTGLERDKKLRELTRELNKLDSENIKTHEIESEGRIVIALC